MTTTISITFPHVPHNLTIRQMTSAIYESWCWCCANPINGGGLDKYHVPDHFTCQGKAECEVRYCDECAMKSGHDTGDDFVCRACAEEEPPFQACDRCEAYHCDDNVAWNTVTFNASTDGGCDIHENVLCPTCYLTFKLPHTSKCECDACERPDTPAPPSLTASQLAEEFSGEE
jgi:hypothetical protein